MSYSVRTPVFEGPFDLLLHLILKQEVELWEVSLREIVDDPRRGRQVGDRDGTLEVDGQVRVIGKIGDPRPAPWRRHARDPHPAVDPMEHDLDPARPAGRPTGGRDIDRATARQRGLDRVLTHGT
jgi:hypothetical protein